TTPDTIDIPGLRFAEVADHLGFSVHNLTAESRERAIAGSNCQAIQLVNSTLWPLAIIRPSQIG
ncbi:TPA: hypothetical protein ACSPMC_004314, partial [Pseudomonas aeruginosa]